MEPFVRALNVRSAAMKSLQTPPRALSERISLTKVVRGWVWEGMRRKTRVFSTCYRTHSRFASLEKNRGEAATPYPSVLW